MVSKTIEQILYAEKVEKPPQHLDDYDKWHYRKKIIPKRRLLTAGLAGSSALLGAGAGMHYHAVKHNLIPSETDIDPKLTDRLKPSMDTAKTFGIASAVSGSGALALGLSRKVKNMHDYRLYKKQRLERNKLPMSFERFEHEVKHLNK
jgi:hypothetical protein